MSPKTEIAMAEKGTHKHRYIFPNFLAKMMSDVDPRTQYESAMLSSFLILFGILATGIMMIFFMDFSVVYKVLIAINIIGGFLYISSSLVTVYQQYANYMDIMEIQKSMIAESQHGNGIQSSLVKKKGKKKYNRWNQFVFWLGLLLVIASISLLFSSVSKFFIKMIPGLDGYIYYLAGALLLIGILFVYLIIRSGRKQLKKAALIERLISEGKIHPRQAPQHNQVPARTEQVIEQPNKRDLGSRLKILVKSIKIAKANKQIEQEEKIKARMKNVLDEIKRLKLSERSTNN